MDSREEIENQMWEDMKSQLYNTKEWIDFSKINDDVSQAKLALFMMEVADFGLGKIIRESYNQILFKLESENRDNSKEEREEIEGIYSDISSCKETIKKIKTERDEIIKRFWSEECEERECDIIDIPELNNEKREFDLPKEKMQKLRDPSPQKFSIYDVQKQLLATAVKNLEEYSPFNDPDNKYGWKEFCNIRQKLYVQSLEKSLEQIKIDDEQDTSPLSCSKVEMALLRSIEKQSVSPHSDNDCIDLLCFDPKKKIERLGTPIEVTDDKQDAPPSSGDKGTKYRENSLRSRNNSTKSKGFDAPKDIDIGSYETSTSSERKKIKIDYSKVKKNLERILKRIEGNQQHSQVSKYLSGSNDGCIRVISHYMWNRSHPYQILIHRALLDFCERHLLNHPDDYLLLGLGYIRFKRTNQEG